MTFFHSLPKFLIKCLLLRFLKGSIFDSLGLPDGSRLLERAVIDLSLCLIRLLLLIEVIMDSLTILHVLLALPTMASELTGLLSELLTHSVGVTEERLNAISISSTEISISWLTLLSVHIAMVHHSLSLWELVLGSLRIFHCFLNFLVKLLTELGLILRELWQLRLFLSEDIIFPFSILLVTTLEVPIELVVVEGLSGPLTATKIS